MLGQRFVFTKSWDPGCNLPNRFYGHWVEIVGVEKDSETSQLVELAVVSAKTGKTLKGTCKVWNFTPDTFSHPRAVRVS